LAVRVNPARANCAGGDRDVHGCNAVALHLAVGGVWLLTDARLAGEPLGFVFGILCGPLRISWCSEFEPSVE